MLCMSTAARRIVLLTNGTIELVQRRQRIDFHAEDIFLDVVRKRLDLVCGMGIRRHRKDWMYVSTTDIKWVSEASTLVQLFERERLCLGNKEQDSKEPDNVPRGIPSECSLGFERSQQTWECDGNNKIAGNINQLAGALLTMASTYKSQVTAVAKDMPTSRIYSGNASAEYVNGTGPSPGEYTQSNR